MHLRTLQLRHFRNHSDSSFEFGDGTNVLLGGNGQGKTNVIEAISYLCLTKSFFTNSDTLVVEFGQNGFEVVGTLASDSEVGYEVRVAFLEPSAEKRYSINRLHIEPLSAVIGRFPIVVCSPEHSPITSGGPAERRKFVDLVVSQSNVNYLQHLLEYRRVLRHRNRLLLDLKTGKSFESDVLTPWDEQLIRHGSYITARRRMFIEEFGSFISSAYRHLVGAGEEPMIRYEPATPIGDETGEPAIADLLRADLRRREGEERRMGSTLVGPHRDEFLLTINDLNLRKFASQGQHKTFLIALKIGEFYYLLDRCRETPIMVLDDVFSELDEERAERLLGFLASVSQTFITSTNPHLFERSVRFDGRNRAFRIQNGVVAEERSWAAA